MLRSLLLPSLWRARTILNQTWLADHRNWKSLLVLMYESSCIYAMSKVQFWQVQKTLFLQRQTDIYNSTWNMYKLTKTFQRLVCVVIFFIQCVWSLDILRVHTVRHISNWHIYIPKLENALISADSFFIYGTTLLTNYQVCLLSVYFILCRCQL